MWDLSKRWLSPPMVVACIALAVAIAGNAGANSLAPSPLVRVKTDAAVTRGSTNFAIARCPSGYSLLTGGFHLISGNVAMANDAFPTKDGEGFLAGFIVPPTVVGAPTKNARFTVVAVCAKKGEPIVLP